LFDRVGDVDETPAIRDFKPKMLCQRFHGFDMPPMLSPLQHLAHWTFSQRTIRVVFSNKTEVLRFPTKP
jgi:hypothetical protein